MYIVHARASSLCVSTLWVHQAITSSLFQSSTILMFNLFIKYYLQFFSIPSYSQRDRCQLLIQCVSDCRSRDPEFDPGLVAYLMIDHEIISIAILLSLVGRICNNFEKNHALYDKSMKLGTWLVDNKAKK